jgi:opacity protein-like surface antigen
MKRFAFAALVLSALLAGGQSFAAGPTSLMSKENFTVGKGDLSTDLMINPQFFRGDFKDDWFQVRLGANYFITDIFAPGVEFEVNHIAGTQARFLPNLKAYWPLHKRFLPYAMVGIGYLHMPGANLINLVIAPGIDYILASNVGIGMQLRYDLGAGNGTFHEIQFPIGFHVYFKI